MTLGALIFHLLQSLTAVEVVRFSTYWKATHVRPHADVDGDRGGYDPAAAYTAQLGSSFFSAHCFIGRASVAVHVCVPW